MKRTSHIYLLAVVGLLAAATVIAVTRSGAEPASHHARGSAGTPRAGCKSRDSRAERVVRSQEVSDHDIPAARGHRTEPGRPGAGARFLAVPVAVRGEHLRGSNGGSDPERVPIPGAVALRLGTKNPWA